MTLVCPDCQIEMRPKTLGVPVESMATFGPYKLYAADLYVCPGCDKKVLTGFQNEPIAHHFEQDYNSIVSSYRRNANRPVARFWANKQEKSKYDYEHPYAGTGA